MGSQQEGKETMYWRRILTVIAMLLTGSIGLFIAMAALGCLGMVLNALWTGVFERPDFRENMGDVRILRATDPEWFWSNVAFYTYISVELGVMGGAITLPLAVCLKLRFRNP
jgi:hypothetical protein